MDNTEALVKLLLEAVNSRSSASISTDDIGEGDGIPVGVSNRHIHISQEDLDTLYGKGYQLTKTKDLGQPGQYACAEYVIVAGPRSAIEKVRILGPVRKETQVELLASDCRKIGIPMVVRQSGDLAGAPGVTIVGPKGSVYREESAVVALRHIHMTPADAEHYGVKDGQVVKIKFGGQRGGIYDKVICRVSPSAALECHLDVEEANAMGVDGSSKFTIIK
jgi:propanediol utilization protein